jgi:hypothetical protein
MKKKSPVKDTAASKMAREAIKKKNEPATETKDLFKMRRFKDVEPRTTNQPTKKQAPMNEAHA